MKGYSIDHIVTIFGREFEPIAGKFIVNILEKDKWDSKEDYIWHPGVYVWYHREKQRVIKVGRHLENARKRALEHVQDNTNNVGRDYVDEGEEYEMGKIRTSDQDNVVLILFNVRDVGDYHWVAAVEIYLERMLNPLIRAGRLG